MSPVTLILPYPISANRFWASRIVKQKGRPGFVSVYVTAEAAEYKRQVTKCVQLAGVRTPILGRVAVQYFLYPHRPLDWQKRMRKDGALWDDTVQSIDLDNAQKVLFDALKNVVFEDDKFVREISAKRMEPDDRGARLVVIVSPIAVEQPQISIELPGITTEAQAQRISEQHAMRARGSLVSPAEELPL